jgi:Zn-dependent M16 (insulinase) family peptidase
MTHSFGFMLLREENIPELNSKGKLYWHILTGAELLSLENDDENKVFGIVFRTPPPDSTGVAHIMEHSVLCGSRKYPVKEPFVQLMKGSLNTFLNAFTFPDKTCYPVASQNLQDFYNLVDVYLDAVFYPLITPETLQQEGWHYELDNLDGAMAFKGVVFNEMKGAYSSPEGVLDEKSQQQVFPDNVYSLDSGGDPTKIPDLTYAAFKHFHETYYSATNARIYFYGDDVPQKRLQILNDYLKDLPRVQVDSSISLQPRFSQPRKVTLPYEVAARNPQVQGAKRDPNAGDGEEGEEPKTLLTVNWLLPEPGDPPEQGAQRDPQDQGAQRDPQDQGAQRDPTLAVGMTVLGHILTGTPASPLRKALIESGLGEDLVGRGLELASRQWFYSVGMKGVRSADADRVEGLILSTLSELAEKGIDPATIAASLNTVEFSLRENNTGRFPRGLAVMLRALSTWLYDGDPFSLLRVDAPLAAVKESVAAGKRYFESLLKDYFLSNNHRVTVVLQPDPELAQRRAAAEQQRLDQARAAMSQAELEAIAANTAELKRRQETPDSPEMLATIPTLTLADLDKQVRKIPTELVQSGDARILYHDLFTNGILYLDLGFNLHSLPQDWLPYIPLFGRALTEMGTHSQTFVQLIQRIGRATGGIDAAPFISAAPQRGPQVQGAKRDPAEAWLFLRSKAMAPQAGELLGILGDILREVRLDDRERFRQMALEEKATLEHGMVQAGHRVVNTRLKSYFSEAGWANEQISGVSYLFFIRELIAQIDQDWPAILQRLEGIRTRLLNRSNMICNVTLDAAHWTALQPQLIHFLNELPGGTPRMETWQTELKPATEGLTIPAQVNFVGKAGSLYQAGYRLHGSYLAILSYLNSTWIWDKVRVQGGAYGGFCLFDQYSGVVSYLSYFDPNIETTLQSYDQTAGFLRQLQLDEAELTKSIIGAVGELDAYQLPDAKGYSSLLRHLLGVTDEWRQQIRDELLGTQPSHFQALANSLEAVSRTGLVAVLGSAEAIQAANASHPGWLEVCKVL